jgi:hypothetical protein
MVFYLPKQLVQGLPQLPTNADAKGKGRIIVPALDHVDGLPRDPYPPRQLRLGQLPLQTALLHFFVCHGFSLSDIFDIHSIAQFHADVKYI